MVAEVEARGAILLRSAPWDALDDTFAARIPMDSPHESADLLARMVADKSATAHQILKDGERIGLLITRVDVGTLGRELVVIAAYSAASGVSILPQIIDAADALARHEQCVSVRFHTARHGLANEAPKFGYRLTELVFRKNVI